MIKLGTSNMAKAYVGSTEVSKMYLGSELVYEAVDYIDWLKSLGCICYLPLSSNGDLMDRISGESLQLSGHGSLVWVSSEGMYRLQTPSNSNANFYVALLNNGMNASSFPNNCFTTLTSVKRITTTGYYLACQLSPVTTTENTKIALNTNYNASGNVANMPNTLVNMATYVGEDERNYYQQGELYTTAAVHEPYLPTNWEVDGNGLQIGTLRNASAVYANKQFYIKDIYIFNTKLTLEQIRKIQGYS